MFFYFTDTRPVTANLTPGLNFCSLVHEPEFFYWYWLPVLVYNSVRLSLFTWLSLFILVCSIQAILALFIVKGIETYRASRVPHVSLLRDVYRQSFVNFLALVFDSQEDANLKNLISLARIFVAYLLCCVLWITSDVSHCSLRIFSTRMLLIASCP